MLLDALSESAPFTAVATWDGHEKMLSPHLPPQNGLQAMDQLAIG